MKQVTIRLEAHATWEKSDGSLGALFCKDNKWLFVTLIAERREHCTENLSAQDMLNFLVEKKWFPAIIDEF